MIQSQKQWVHTQLIAGQRLTALDALRGCGCLRLAARVRELRDLGYPVNSRKVQRGDKWVAEYSAG